MSTFVKYDHEKPSQSIHIWVGALGIHIFYPELWHSRLDWCGEWDKPIN